MEGEREGDRAEHVFQCVISVRALSVDIGPVRIALAKKQEGNGPIDLRLLGIIRNDFVIYLTQLLLLWYQLLFN